MKKLLLILLLLVACGSAFAQTPGTSQGPATLDTSVTLFEVANRASSTLSGSITNSATSLTLASGASFPSSGAISIDSEIIYYTGKSTNTLTGLLRGKDGTSAASHSSGVAVSMRITAAHHKVLADAIIATQTFVRGTGTNANDTAWSSTGASSTGIKFADSTSSSSTSSANPSAVFQTWRSGGTYQVGQHAYNFAMYKNAGTGDTYAFNILLRYTPDMASFPNETGTDTYNQHGLNVYTIGAPTNVNSGVTREVYIYNWVRTRIDAAGIAGQGLQLDVENYSSANSDLDASTAARTIALATNSAGNKQNSVAWYHQASSKATAYSLLMRPTPNSVFGYGADFKDMTFELQGTVATSSTAVTGTSTFFTREVKVGDQLLINSVYYTVTLVTDDTHLTLATSAGTQSGQTVSKPVIPLRLAHQANIVARNSAGNADYRFARLASDVWQMDPDARSVNFGSFISFGTNTIGAPSDTLTTGWRGIDYLASGNYYGWGIESGYRWTMGNAHKTYVGPSSAPVLAQTIESTGQMLQVGSASHTFTRTVSGAVSAIQSAIQVGLDNGTMAIGGGPSMLFFADDDGGAKEFMGRVGAIWENVTSGAEQAAVGIYVRPNAANTTADTLAALFSATDGARLTAEYPLTLNESSNTPANPTSSNQGRIYLKGDKLIIQFNDAGTVRYKYLDLTGTGVTWQHSTSAP